MVIETYSEDSQESKHKMVIETDSEDSQESKLLVKYTHKELDAALGLLMLHSTEVYKTYHSLKLPTDTMEDARTVAVTAQKEWELKMEEIAKDAESALQGSRYENYVYKGQMARNLVPYAERSAQQRQRNNEASRRSRFLKSRKEFIKVQMNQNAWQLDDELEQELQAIRSTCNVLESQVRNLGYNMDVFINYWNEMEDEEFEYREELLNGAKNRGKRKRDSMD